MNNQVKLIGITKDENHIEITRPSGIVDTLMVSIPSEMVGSKVCVTGEFVSSNTFDRKLKLYVLPFDISYTNDDEINSIHLEGFVCKTPIYRRTPAGKRITDILLAVNHNNNSSYLPCIYWGDASTLKIGDKISIDGRIQSRQYEKNNLIHTVYEVSIEEIGLI